MNLAKESETDVLVLGESLFNDWLLFMLLSGRTYYKVREEMMDGDA